MDRRSFLFGLGGLGTLLGLAGCRKATSSLKVSLLARSIPSQLVSRFESVAETDVQLSISSSLKQLFVELQQFPVRGEADTGPQTQLSGQSQPSSNQPSLKGSPQTVPHLSMLGDYWLSVTIAQGLIQPLPVQQWQGWNELPAQWKTVAKRNRQGQRSESGEIWGAPYRWGATVIAYRKDVFRQLGWLPTDWADLWRPELKNKISLLDHPRETIGLTLKKLNYSYNTTDLAAVPDLLSNLQTLNQQAKFYSSVDYLQPLIRKDIWAAVGWSTDILPEVDSEADLGFIVPQSGTALWCDLWICPTDGASPSGSPIQKWIEFWWKPDVAEALTQFTDAISPALKDFSSSGTAKDALLPNHPWFDKSEFLDPLPVAALEQYQTIWRQMRA